MPQSPITEGARIELWQFGAYWEDGVRREIGPIISDVYLDANGNWTKGYHNALDPGRSFAIDGVSDEEVASSVALFRRLAEIGERSKGGPSPELGETP